jgi:membrane fusion protein, copper/silver efflux system
MKNIQNFFFLFIFLFAGIASAQNQDVTKTDTNVSTPNLGKVDKVVKKQLNDLLLAYFQIKDELVAGRQDNANTKGQLFLEVLAKVDTQKMTTEQVNFFTEQQKQFVNSAKNISNNKEIAAQRVSFAELSKVMKMVVVSFKANSQKVYEQYCPMAFDDLGASWLSAQNKVLNPYYGDMMLKCGIVAGEF